MIRDKQMPINGWLYSQLKLVAELQNYDCAETVAELFIRERLDAMPEIADLAMRRAAKRKEADAEWKAAWKADDGPLPF